MRSAAFQEDKWLNTRRRERTKQGPHSRAIQKAVERTPSSRNFDEFLRSETVEEKKVAYEPENLDTYITYITRYIVNVICIDNNTLSVS